jgi:NAD(P)-dependent dehydrogenase (short-subunit alcohol dehydrogenase family)
MPTDARQHRSRLGTRPRHCRAAAGGRRPGRAQRPPARSFPIQRLGTAAEVADLICFLASEQAGYITGASLDINGGDLMI